MSDSILTFQASTTPASREKWRKTSTALLQMDRSPEKKHQSLCAIHRYSMYCHRYSLLYNLLHTVCLFWPPSVKRKNPVMQKRRVCRFYHIALTFQQATFNCLPLQGTFVKWSNLKCNLTEQRQAALPSAPCSGSD